jgi:hypothetical protein
MLPVDPGRRRALCPTWWTGGSTTVSLRAVLVPMTTTGTIIIS